MPNPYPTDSIWIGDRYNDPTNTLRGALILGESAWSGEPGDPQWIYHFINKGLDHTFARLHWFMTGVGLGRSRPRDPVQEHQQREAEIVGRASAKRQGGGQSLLF
jgi:hypothetical protein